MEQLINKIEQWGYDKNIHLASPLIQTTKIIEEATELMQGVFRYVDEERCRNCEYREEDISADYGFDCTYIYNCIHLTEIKDAIGDIFVTLVMLSIQVEDVTIKTDQKTTNECYLQEDIRSIFSQTFYIQDNLQLKRCVNTQVNNIMYFLHYIAKNYDLTLKECVEYAYNEIKDRKGEIKNGLWVKNK